MTDINDWAQHWNIPPEAITDLYGRLGVDGTPAQTGAKPNSEQDAQQHVRLEASRKGKVLWRNNTGATEDHVRYGLCNDSPKVNKRLKSADLVGIAPVIVTMDMVGHKVGVFLTREMKAPGWIYTGTPEEVAQLRWLTLVTSMGGNAAFATGEGTL